MEQYQLNTIPPSKKNSKKIVCRGRRPILLPSDAFTKWHPIALREILQQKQGEVITRCTKVSLEFYQKYKYVWDLSNKAESVMDLLVDAEIIQDDNYKVVPELNLKYFQSDTENKVIIKIT